LASRGTFIDVGGVRQPAPAPRFSRTPSGPPTAPEEPGAHTRDVLQDWGIDNVEELLTSGVVQHNTVPRSVQAER